MTRRQLLVAGCLGLLLAACGTASGAENRELPNRHQDRRRRRLAKTLPPSYPRHCLRAPASRPPVGFALPVSELEEAANNLRLPLDDWTALGGRFGDARGSEHIHADIDFDLGSHPGSTVFSPCSGTVLAAGFEREFGLNMTFDCGYGWTVRLAYLGELLADRSDTREAGEMAGHSDRSGALVHFGLRWDGIPIDPESVLEFIRMKDRVTPTPVPTETPTPPSTPTTTPTRLPRATQPPEPTSTPTPIPATTTVTKTPPPTLTPTLTPTPTPRPPTATPTSAPLASY